MNRRFVKEGEDRQADFINIVAWGKTAEFCSKYFRKGMQIALVGRIQTRTYDDTEGKKHYVTEVVAEEVYFADSKKEQQEPKSDMQFENTTSNITTDFENEPLPF